MTEALCAIQHAAKYPIPAASAVRAALTKVLTGIA
jgi:hypothetical protein